MTGPAPYSLQWHEQIKKRSSATAARDHDDDGFPDDLGQVGQTLPPGVQFKAGAEPGILEIWNVVDTDNPLLIGRMARDGSYFSDTVGTGSASYQFGGKHTLGSAGEQAGFLNLITNLFYAPSIWETTSQDGDENSLSQRRVHGPRVEFNSDETGVNTTLYVDYTMDRTPPENMVFYSASSIIEPYTGLAELHIYQDGKEIGAMKQEVSGDGVSFVEFLLKYPLYLLANKPVTYELKKPNGDYIRARPDNNGSGEPYYKGYMRTWKDIQPILGEEIVTASNSYISNVHYIADTTAGFIDLTAQTTTNLLNFRVTTMAMVDSTDYVEVDLGAANGKFKIEHPNSSYIFMKDGTTWYHLNCITGEVGKMEGTDKVSTDNKDFFGGGSQTGGDTVFSGEINETSGTPTGTSLTADTWASMDFTTVSEVSTDKPVDLTEDMWSGSKFNLGELKKGDSVELQVLFDVTPNINNCSIEVQFTHHEDAAQSDSQYLGRLEEGAGEAYGLEASFTKTINHDNALTNDIGIRVKASQTASAQIKQVIFTVHRRSA